MDFFTADQHFGHKNIVNLANRGIIADEMDDVLFSSWNSVVRNKDTVYVLGDFIFPNDTYYISTVISRLNGKIKLVRGNHDSKKTLIHDSIELLSDIFTYRNNGVRLILSHYPLEEWEGFFRGYYHLHGHTHGNMREIPNRLDVGVDNVGYCPLSFEEVLDRFGHVA